jgi:galactokinase
VIDPERLARAFEAQFGRPPGLYRAPGRVNLIGEHTDYNDGFVMPMAIDRSTWVAAAPRRDRLLVVRSHEYGDAETIDLDGPRVGPTGRWSDYMRGVAAVLDRPGLHGADFLITTDVPIGGGLSSSAALEVACGYALLDLAQAHIDLTALARACQRAEHEFVGTRCGVMDQMIACHGRAGHVMKLDTRSLHAAWLPLPETVRVLVCNTMVAHDLASAEYNARRADCEAGVRALARRFPEVRSLRDANLRQLDAIASDAPDGADAADRFARLLRRCRHVITENARVERAAAALVAGNFHQLGLVMAESHRSLRDDYEVSCAELDVMATITAALDGVHGARMTGGGFGGCVVALVDAAKVDDELKRQIRERYAARTGLRPEIWVCAAGPGVAAWPRHSTAAVDR